MCVCMCTDQLFIEEKSFFNFKDFRNDNLSLCSSSLGLSSSGIRMADASNIQPGWNVCKKDDANN